MCTTALTGGKTERERAGRKRVLASTRLHRSGKENAYILLGNLDLPTGKF